jgi:tetratricopeptide (TPR) repeat protein
VVNYYLEDHDNAINDFTKAIALDDANPVYYDNRALSKAEKEDYSGSIDDYTKSIELYPNDPETYYQRALVKISMNNQYDACLDLKRAEELGSTEAKAEIKKNCK